MPGSLSQRSGILKSALPKSQGAALPRRQISSGQTQSLEKEARDLEPLKFLGQTGRTMEGRDNSMAEKIQLFATTGNMDAEVSIPWDAEIVVWQHKYYALRDGRYVQCNCVAGFIEEPKTAASLVGFQIRRR